MKISRIDYCQYLLSSQINYTLTNFAEHGGGFSHDSVNRFLRHDKLTGKIVWKYVNGDLIQSENGFLVFDDTVLDKIILIKSKWCTGSTAGTHTGLSRALGWLTVCISPRKWSLLADRPQDF